MDSDLCECGDVFDEHDADGCTVPGCDCIAFEPQDDEVQ